MFAQTERSISLDQARNVHSQEQAPENSQGNLFCFYSFYNVLFSGFPVRLGIFVNANSTDTKQAVTFLDHELKSPDSVWSKEEIWL